jgi:predicted nucleic acid-binding protein
VKSFFDTSVLVASFLVSHEHHERSFSLLASADRRHACCAAHSLAELYATLTRLPGKQRLTVDQALLSLDSVAARLDLITLDVSEYRNAIRDAAQIGITGGTIYDALSGRCAIKARASKIYTWNMAHFRLLGPDIAERMQTP